LIEKIKLLSIIVLITLTIFQIPACSTEKYASSSGIDEAIKTLQKKVPFTIIAPTYFPEGIVTRPSVATGPDKGQLSKNSVIINIKYWQPGSTNIILIFEENIEVNWSLSKESNIIDISGIKVVEEDATQLGISESKIGFQYNWNKDGINIHVIIYGYEKEECRKVVESMINPSGIGEKGE
jgi:hypothetical protein